MMIHSSHRRLCQLRFRRRMRMKYRRWMGPWRQERAKPRHFGPRARWRWAVVAYDEENPF